MAGLESILDIISSQQKQTESSIISAAEKKAESIRANGKEKAAKEYEDYLRKAKAQLSLDYDNAISSVDAQMKRKALAYKVECVDDVIGKTLEKLNNLPYEEYFSIISSLIIKKKASGDGVLHFNARDLKRIPQGFSAFIGGMNITVSDEPVEIENGFILSYGLISENCSFRAIIEAERESVRDMAAKVLFGQVKK